MRFESLPRFLRQLIFSLMGWRNYFYRYNRSYRSFREFLQNSSLWLISQQDEWQRQKLLGLVNSARNETEYYSKCLPSHEDIATRGDLRDILNALPLLDKDSLRRHPGSFLNSSVNTFVRSSTSGSTGSPLEIEHDAASLSRRFALINHHLNSVGITEKSASIRLSGRIICAVNRSHAKPWLYNEAENQLFLSTYHINDQHSAQIIEKFEKFKPRLLDGYPSGVLELLRLLRRHSYEPTSLRAIVTTAESLGEAARAELVELSGGEVPVMDYYSASEGLPLIQQCMHGTYHVRWQSGICEVDDNGKIGFEGDGELICTSFVQDRTPLIRYRTGDLVEGLSPTIADVCECGLRSPVIRKVLGRVEDVIQTPDGRALGMFTYRTLKHIQGLGETQVIQHDFAVFEVNTVALPDGYTSSSLAKELSGSFERALGYPIKLQLNLVGAIAKGPHGKVRLVISRII
ncbi:MAG: hypothetical protein V7744_19750 [Pseudomonadales bacterium]